MKNLAIISSSVRSGRLSHRVALYFRNYIEENRLASVRILDLKEYNFPLFDERLKFQKDPSREVIEFAERIRDADGILIVTPEYNGGYPASLKNVVDLLYEEWHGKPLAIATVSDGHFGGSQVITSLLFSLWKMRVRVVTAMFPVPRAMDVFDENGIPKDKDRTDKRASNFLRELFAAM